MLTQVEYKRTGLCHMCKSSNLVENDQSWGNDEYVMGRELMCVPCSFTWITMYSPIGYTPISPLLDCAECKKDVEVEELEWDFKNGLVCKECRYPNRDRQLRLPI